MFCFFVVVYWFSYTFIRSSIDSILVDETFHWCQCILALPQVINQLPEEDRIRYVKLMEDSATERRYFVRIMIVGKEGVGKTCLLRRLLNESIDDVYSTDGVDIVVRRCKINIHDGEWTIEKGRKN